MGMQIQLDLAEIPFSLNHTLFCGQTFRWKKRGDWWTGVVSQTAVKIHQENDTLEFKASSNAITSDFLFQYFRLDDDLPSVYSKIMKDKYVREAINKFRGLRLIRQEPWECLISYICATNKNIPAIKQSISNLCRRFGYAVRFEGEDFYTFPNVESLAKARLTELKRCKLGYRSETLLETAKLVWSGRFDLEHLRTMPYEKAKKELLMLPGVGPKVADCTLLFSLDRLEAFPIDVWMKRIVFEYYSQHFETQFIARMKSEKGLSLGEYKIIHSFGRKYFGDYSGYAQEYLYHYRRCRA
jgi:N-glycosylase/DNA lyase